MENYREELLKGMKELIKENFKCYILKENNSFLYGFIITPKDNIIYIQRAYLGWITTLKYIPSKDTGSGCNCLEEPFQTITKDIIVESEREGLIFAKKLKAQLYKNSNEFINKLWNKSEYEEVL
jgi:hypothetical protein